MITTGHEWIITSGKQVATMRMKSKVSAVHFTINQSSCNLLLLLKIDFAHGRITQATIKKKTFLSLSSSNSKKWKIRDLQRRLQLMLFQDGLNTIKWKKEIFANVYRMQKSAHTYLRQTSLDLCSDMLSTGTKCVEFPDHVQSTELTAGGLQLSCRNISRMISGNGVHLS